VKKKYPFAPAANITQATTAVNTSHAIIPGLPNIRICWFVINANGRITFRAPDGMPHTRSPQLGLGDRAGRINGQAHRGVIMEVVAIYIRKR